MRKIEVLNNKYEKVGLYKVLVNGKNYKDLFDAYGNAATEANLQTIATAESVELNLVKFWYEAYLYLSYGTQKPTLAYAPSGPSKYDVAYINKTIDDPIAELNGHTLREVFEDGKLIEGTWGIYSSTIIENTEEFLKWESTGISVYSLARNNYGGLTIGDYYYVNGSMRALTSGINQLNVQKIGNTHVVKDFPTLNEWYDFSFTAQQLDHDAEEFRAAATLATSVSGIVAELKKPFIVNLNDFGISPITDMDYYYSLYQERKNITKKVLTYADVFEERNLITTFPELTVGNNTNYYMTAASNNIDYVYDTKYYRYIEIKNNFNSSPYVSSYYASPLEEGFRSFGSLTIPTQNEYHSFSDIYHWLFNTQTRTLRVYSETENVYDLQSNDELHIRNWELISFEHFDELITKELLDTMLAHYLLVKNIVIYPEIYVPTDPTGFGNRYAFLELNKKVYGHELDFENINLNLLFGVYKNAYDSYNQLMNFIINNEGIIAYDYGKGVRYTDIRLIKSPKTELDDGQYLKEKFDFKRLSPFYTLEQGSSLTIKNIHDWDIKPIVSGTVNTNIVYIEAEESTSGLLKAVKFDFTALTKPFDFYYNAETKQILINGINNGYQYIDFSYGISFISLPKDSEYVIWTTGITSPTVKAKKWVID
jgi:hypothetical protein